MATNLDKGLDSWIKNSLNVLLVGPHGIGKTERVLQAMDRAGYKYLYFSASTMDPFTDLVGIPRVVKNDDGSQYIEFVKPKQVADANFDYIVVDEFNRSHKKVRNALMECVQFKSLNGVKMPNLKGIIAMINPPDDDDTYDVERLDPAQEDRFHIKVTLPNGPSKDFFKKKFGDLGEIAVNWWSGIDSKFKAKGLVSPRRLEYAISIYQMGIDIEDVLPKEVNVKLLKTELAKAGLSARLPELKKMKPDALKKELQGNGNLRELVLARIIDGDFPAVAVDAFSDEEITNACDNTAITNYICNQIEKDDARYIGIGKTISQHAINNGAISSKMKNASTQISRAILANQTAKTREASLEERKSGSASEELKRKIGEISRHTSTSNDVEDLLKNYSKDIAGDEVYRTMLGRLNAMRPTLNIKDICRKHGVILP